MNFLKPIRNNEPPKFCRFCGCALIVGYYIKDPKWNEYTGAGTREKLEYRTCPKFSDWHEWGEDGWRGENPHYRKYTGRTEILIIDRSTCND